MPGIGPRADSEADTTPDADPGPPEWQHGITAGEAMRTAEQIETETAYRQQAQREAFAQGRELGRAEHVAMTEAAWAAAREVPDPEMIDTINRAAAAERQATEEARWGPGGRYHFADARPGDFPGRQNEQPQQEAEAG